MVYPVSYAAGTSNIARVVVFGSYARDRISPWSDLDLLIVRDGGPADLVDDIIVPAPYRAMRSVSSRPIIRIACKQRRSAKRSRPKDVSSMHVPLDDRVRRWLDQAETDLAIARELRERYSHQACFHAQQSAGKSLKALITRRSGDAIPTHEIGRLLGAMEPLGIDVPGGRMEGEAVENDVDVIRGRLRDAACWRIRRAMRSSFPGTASRAPFWQVVEPQKVFVRHRRTIDARA
jgi:HEPN domain-containing protein